jgi:hypothetical protein
MATFEDEYRIKETLRNKLIGLSKFSANDFVRTEDLGKELNFETGVPIFERILKLFNELLQANLDDIPYNTLTAINSHAENAFSKFMEIREFSLVKYPQNAVAARDGLINALKDNYNGYFQTISQIIAYSARNSTNFAGFEIKAKEALDGLEKIKKEFEEKQIQSLKETESILEKVRIASAEVGVTQHATHFKEEADDHMKQSKRWLIATLVVTTLTIIWGIISFFIHAPSVETAQIIQFTVAKLIILSALYYGIVWCAKNYNAHRHNYVVNKHRQNSLKTFETFVKAAGDDPETKNAILLQTTFSIFSSQQSGYIQKDSEADSPNKIIEIFKSVNSNMHR